MTPEPIPPRRHVYPLLITLAVAAVCGHILSAGLLYEPALHIDSPTPVPGKRVWPQKRPEPMPSFGSNDRSRWATIRALVEECTYEIGRRNLETGKDEGIGFEPGWQSVDVVMNPQTKVFYSSKPPLLSTILAGEYWLLKQVFGWSINDPLGRWYVMRTILLTVNALPLLLYLVLLARLVERLGTTDWGRLYVVAAACFGTFVTTFCLTLNNHTPAAFFALFAVYPVMGALLGSAQRSWGFIVSGLCAGFAACVELPAAAFLAGLFGLLLLRSPGRTLLLFVPAAALVVAALLLTNYLAIGEIVPAYSKFGSDWYRYPGSHWNRPPEQQQGIDWAANQESRATYVFHLLLGHHGLFLLSPIYLLSVVGMLVWVRGAAKDARPQAAKPGSPVMLALLTLYLTVVVLGFFLFVTGTRNYGGWTNGPRWVLWLIPFWLLTMLPVVDWLAGRRWGRFLGYFLLAVSVLSASYTPWNPWRHPWMYNWLEAHGWIGY